MNATPEQIRDAHLIVHETADFIATQSKTTRENFNVAMRSTQPDVSVVAKEELFEFHRQMEQRITNTLVQLGMTPEEDRPGVDHSPPFPRSWNREKMEVWVYDQFGIDDTNDDDNLNLFERNIKCLVTSCTVFGDRINSSTLKHPRYVSHRAAIIAEQMESISERMTKIAAVHLALYTAADDALKLALPTSDKETRRSLAAAGLRETGGAGVSATTKQRPLLF